MLFLNYQCFIFIHLPPQTGHNRGVKGWGRGVGGVFKRPLDPCWEHNTSMYLTIHQDCTSVFTLRGRMRKDV